MFAYLVWVKFKSEHSTLKGFEADFVWFEFLAMNIARVVTFTADKRRNWRVQRKTSKSRSVVQMWTAVTAYFLSKQLLLFAFAGWQANISNCLL